MGRGYSHPQPTTGSGTVLEQGRKHPGRVGSGHGSVPSLFWGASPNASGEQKIQYFSCTDMLK